MNRYYHTVPNFDYSGKPSGEKQDLNGPLILRDIVIGLFVFVVLMMGGCPYYNVWQQGLAGQAELRRAEQNRQIRIEEAAARKESAADLAEAERIRAQGVKDANDIIAEGLGGPEGYLRYLYIQVLDNGKNQVIYLPTEAGLPILEARRRLETTP